MFDPKVRNLYARKEAMKGSRSIVPFALPMKKSQEFAFADP